MKKSKNFFKMRTALGMMIIGAGICMSGMSIHAEQVFGYNYVVTDSQYLVNPKDSKSIIAVGDILSGFGREIEKLLAVSASTKASDLVEIIGQYNMLNFNSVICTKMDETYHAGNIISALEQTGKSLAYITTGSKISSGLESPRSERVLEFLEGFDAV